LRDRGVPDLFWVHSELATHYSRLGRPSIDRVLMIRILMWHLEVSLVGGGA